MNKQDIEAATTWFNEVMGLIRQCMLEKTKDSDLSNEDLSAIKTILAALQLSLDAVEPVDVGFNWSVGFPDENCMCLVELEDGENIVTYYRHTPRTDTWGDKSKTGWTCLTGSHTRVKKWVKTNLLRTTLEKED